MPREDLVVFADPIENTALFLNELGELALVSPSIWFECKSTSVNGGELRATHDDAGVAHWVAPRCAKVLDNGALALCHGTTHHITAMHDNDPFCTGLREHY